MFQLTGLFLTNQSTLFWNSLAILFQNLFFTLAPGVNPRYNFIAFFYATFVFKQFDLLKTLNMQSERLKSKHSANSLIKWAIPGLFFVYFCLFKQTLHTNICEKCPSSIWCWDSNPGPWQHESPPISTRPGLSR